jgi:uncharacterized membrane protein
MGLISDPFLHEWGGLLLRWLHVIAGIAWIGASFYFMHLDNALRPSPDIPVGKGGEAWEVHGGGFYQVRKFLVAPAQMPSELMWHKWESYTTWLSGFCLLVWVYYAQSDLYLIDPAVRSLTATQAALIGLGGLALGFVVYDLLCRSPLGRNDVQLGVVLFVFVVFMAFVFQKVFSGRGALLHTGALMATIMTGNVFFNIIPGQRKVVASLIAGQTPDPAIGKAAKQRSTHNNYLTLPVLFLMLSNHYPLTYSTQFTFAIVGLVLVAGALIRHFYNQRHAGHGDPWWTWAVSAVCIGLAAAISLTGSPSGREWLGLAAIEPVDPPATRPDPPQQVVDIIIGRCSMCHAAQPVWDGIGIAPKGVHLDSPQAIARNAEAIRVQAVISHAMPPNNITAIEPEERQVLAAWLATPNR